LTNNVNRLAILDYSRGIAALAVVFFHFFYKGPAEGWVAKTDYGFLTALGAYGYLGVHFFFIISGFVIAISAEGRTWQEFLTARAVRLFPALWACATLTLTVLLILRQLTPPEIGLIGTYSQPEGGKLLQSWIASLTLVPSWFGVAAIDGSYWSLVIEIHFYLAIALIIFFKQQNKAKFILVLWLGASALNTVVSSWRVDFALNLSWAPFLAAGVLFSQWYQKGPNFRIVVGLLTCFALSIIYVDAKLLVNSGEIPIISFLLIVLFFTFFAAVSSKKLSCRSTSLSRFSGGITYPLYLVHQIIGYALFNFAFNNFHFVNSNATIVMFSILILSVLMAYMVHSFIEIPITSLWRTFKLKNTS
jgi:peptidoglycan/LPS O-acetylase OafA/YrhL